MYEAPVPSLKVLFVERFSEAVLVFAVAMLVVINMLAAMR